MITRVHSTTSNQPPQKSPLASAASAVAARFGAELLGAHPAGVIQKNRPSSVPWSVIYNKTCRLTNDSHQRDYLNPVRMLYSGFNTGMVLNSMKIMTKFVSYDVCYEWFSRQLIEPGESMTRQQKLLTGLACGATAGVIEISTTALPEYITTLKALQRSYASDTQIIRDCIKHQGIKGVFRGWSSGSARAGISNMIVFGGNEYCKEVIGNDSFSQKFAAGAVPGFFAAIASNPFEVIGAAQRKRLPDMPMLSMKESVIKAHQKIGWGMIYQGLGPKIIRTSLLYGWMFLLKDWVETKITP